MDLCLFVGFLSYLVKQHHVLPASMVYCSFRLSSKGSLSFIGTYLILAMTFERFYSIVRPHKASSFNTVQKAKQTCFCIIVMCIIYNIPQAFLFEAREYTCVAYAKNMNTLGTMYYGLSVILDFIFPFVALLAMNSVIIHTIRTRKILSVTSQKGQKDQKFKMHEKQIYAMLLLVSFAFLILTTSPYVLFLFNLIIDFNQLSPKYQAAHVLVYSITQKLNCTNNGINFFLYVLSGKKFRDDFLQLFRCRRHNKTFMTNSSFTNSTAVDLTDRRTENNNIATSRA